ncbi:MAG: DUF2871 domain-containing protein, partial [Malacoplasma sp.]|nr:DUF2871 domain-containing protein [Malacoplasma sp.]
IYYWKEYFMKKEKKNFKQIIKQPIIWILIAATFWLAIGLMLGIFYDFFFLFGGSAKFDPLTGNLTPAYAVFDERIYVANPHFYHTQLSVLHVHTLVLGFVVNLILILFEKVFSISKKKKLFLSSFILYNFALLLVIIFMMIRGLDWVFNIDYELVHVKTNADPNTTSKNDGFYEFVVYNTTPYYTVPAALTAIPHVLMGVAFICYVICLYFGVSDYIKKKKLDNSNQNIKQ